MPRRLVPTGNSIRRDFVGTDLVALSRAAESLTRTVVELPGDSPERFHLVTDIFGDGRVTLEGEQFGVSVTFSQMRELVDPTDGFDWRDVYHVYRADSPFDVRLSST